MHARFYRFLTIYTNLAEIGFSKVLAQLASSYVTWTRDGGSISVDIDQLLWMGKEKAYGTN